VADLKADPRLASKERTRTWGTVAPSVRGYGRARRNGCGLLVEEFVAVVGAGEGAGVVLSPDAVAVAADEIVKGIA